METAWAIKNGSLLDLSEQNLVSCVASNSGCQGGYPPYAFAYERSTGIASESAYPYTATTGTCKSVAPKTFTTDWWYVGTDETQLTTQLYNRGALVYSKLLLTYFTALPKRIFQPCGFQIRCFI
jgi:hypothetical protein